MQSRNFDQKSAIVQSDQDLGPSINRRSLMELQSDIVVALF